jgi:glycosyltransferase involved in cell wall biosynthesis
MRRLDILLATEAMAPQPGGSERFAQELLGALSRRHRVRALVLGALGRVDRWVAPASRFEVLGVEPPAHRGERAWRRLGMRIQRLQDAAAEVLRTDPPDVLMGQLYAGGGALDAARAAGVPGLLYLASHDPLCHWGFGRFRDSCRPESRCRACPGALGLPDAERAELLRVRDQQYATLAAAQQLVAPSVSVASTCARLAGRRPHVAPPIVRAPRPLAARPDGHVLLVSSVWRPEKGLDIVEPIARRLPGRRVVVQAPNGVPEPTRSALAGLPNVELREREAPIEEALDGAGLLLVASQLPEPFGRVAFEGMAAGVPTLASATGGLPEFVPAEQLVWLHGDPDAWARAARAMERPGRWRAARQCGLDAAAAVLRLDTPRRMERWLAEAAARAAAPARG